MASEDSEDDGFGSKESEGLDSEVEEEPDVENGSNGGIGIEESEAKEHNSDDDEITGKSQKKRKRLRDAREGKTVFIRNLPFDASEEEICNLFEKFGKIAYCKIVVDDVTQHSKGCAFVKFDHKQSAEDCLEKCKVDDADPNSDVETEGK